MVQEQHFFFRLVGQGQWANSTSPRHHLGRKVTKPLRESLGHRP